MVKDLNVAVITDSPLPDARVEKNLILHMELNKNGTVHLIGPGKPMIIDDIIKIKKIPLAFKFARINWSQYARLGLMPDYNALKRKINELLKKIRPDFIYAHNIFAAKLANDLNYDFVMDDHELYHFLMLMRAEEEPLFKKIKTLVKANIWARWTDEIIGNVSAIITVSERIKEYYKSHFGFSKVYVIPNFPHSYEIFSAPFFKVSKVIQDMINKYGNNKLMLAYIGKGIFPPTPPYRDLTFVKDIVKKLRKKVVLFVLGTRKIGPLVGDYVIGLGYVYHLVLYNILKTMHVGLSSWRPHKFQAFCNPNKIFIYTHAGLLNLATITLEEAKRYIDHQTIFVYDPTVELPNVLIDLYEEREEIENTREKRIQYARKNLLFDKYRDVLQKVYELF